MFKQALLLLTAIGWLFLSIPSSSYGEAPSEKTKSGSKILDDLAELARSDPGYFYYISEIKDGVARTVPIHPSIRCHNTYSVAKLFATTAIGILEDREKLNTDDYVYPIFADRFPDGFDQKWKQVRICDVLKHQIGFEQGFLDIDAEIMTSWGTDDFLQLVLEHPLKYQPGTESVYSDAAFYFVSRIVSEKCGEKLDDFLIRELLVPLNFSEYAFSKCPQGYPIGATGMYIATEDMAKLGQLYLQKGVYNGKRILSERFVEKAFSEGFELYPTGQSGDAFYKGGMYGQLLYINRKTNRVIAVHSFQGDIGKILDYLDQNDR